MPHLESLHSTPSIPQFPEKYAREHATEEENALPRIAFQEAGNGVRECVHPEILTEIPSDKAMHDDNTIAVRLRDGGTPFITTFEEYLQSIDVPYNAYRAAFHQEKEAHGSVDHEALFKRLHKQRIDYRTSRTIPLHERFTHVDPRKDNLQEETTKAHSFIFHKIFNDLGLEGIRVERGLPREDYLDGIDEYLVFSDPEKADDDSPSDMHEIYLGVQRSFNDKREEVRRDPWRHIPEKSDQRKILRVGLHEKFKDYGLDEHGKGSGYAQKLYDARADKASQQQKKPTDVRFGPIYKVLADNPEEGMKRQIDWSLSILQPIRSEIALLVNSSDATEADRELAQQYHDAVTLAIVRIERERE